MPAARHATIWPGLDAVAELRIHLPKGIVWSNLAAGLWGNPRTCSAAFPHVEHYRQTLPATAARVVPRLAPIVKLDAVRRHSSDPLPPSGIGLLFCQRADRHHLGSGSHLSRMLMVVLASLNGRHSTMKRHPEHHMLSLSAIANTLLTKVVSRGAIRRDQPVRSGDSQIRYGRKEPSNATKRTGQVRFRKQQVVGSNPTVGSSLSV